MFTMKINAQEATAIAQNYRRMELHHIVDHIADRIAEAAGEGKHTTNVVFKTPNCWGTEPQMMFQEIKKILEENGYNASIQMGHNAQNYASIFWKKGE